MGWIFKFIVRKSSNINKKLETSTIYLQNNRELFISLRIEYIFVSSHRCRYNARLNSRPIPDWLLPRELMILNTEFYIQP